MEKIILAYSIDNAALAHDFDSKLSRIGVPFEHLTEQPGAMPGQFVASIQATTAPVILFITDNFLKSIGCMANALPMLQQLVRTNRIVPVVADGQQPNPATGQLEPVETHFERVIHAITYMNFWQSVYLEMRTKKESVQPHETDRFERDLRAVRDISNEIGEFLNTLRNADHIAWKALAANDFELFFKKFGITEFHETYRKSASFDAPTNDFALKRADFNQAEPVFQEEKLMEKVAETVRSTADHLVEMPLAEPVFPTHDVDFEQPQIFEEKASEPVAPPIEIPVFEKKSASSNGHFHPENESLPTPVLTEKLAAPDSQPEIQAAPPIENQPEISNPTDAEIEALVKEIVREEQEALAEKLPAAAFVEPVLEPIQPPDLSPVLEKKSSLAEPENKPVLEAEIPESRPVQQMQVPHFQPVAFGEDDFEITLRDARYWLERGQLEHASQQAKELLMKYPARAEGYFLLAEVAENQGDYSAARLNFEKSLLLDEQLPGVHLRLARLLDLRFKGQKKQAAAHFREAAKANPTDAESTYRAATIYFEHLGKTEKAIRFFKKTVERQPEHSLAWYDLAHLYRQNDQKLEAAEAWNRAIEINPGLFSETEGRLFVQPDWAAESTQVVENQEVESAEFSADEVVIAQPQISKPNILTVLITGATSGIGRATAEIFAKNGHRVLLTGRRSERLDELKTRFQTDFQNEVETLNFDVRDRESVKSAMENLPENWREIDLLINNAGLARGFDFIHEGNFEHWETMIDTNLKGLLFMTRQVAPGMVARRRGHIINVGSIAGKEVYPKGNVYCATKFAVDALTRAMRLDLVPHGVRVSSVSPGHVEETEFALVRFDGDAEKAAIYADFQPLTSHDIADTIYFIATRPAHIQIHDVVLTGSQQASATQIDRSGRP